MSKLTSMPVALALALVLAACSDSDGPVEVADNSAAQAQQPAVVEVSDKTEEEAGVTNPLCHAEEGMPGGWQDADVTEDVEAALNFVLQRMNSAAQLEKILSVKTQVVAGLNYAIDLKLDNGEIWNTRVYRDLQGNFEVTQPAQQGSMTEDC
ncbi:cystatin domain-containing protein [Halioglobus sp. HI00S01]|uniref:cystatin domain-containing protein n=1 Tax=Halioglobus sp. HI00S01 TaxID=1822214 RepID=UPI000B1D0FB1|nr:cystatin domain-containing protein [Halioglobus sp. HI00S01]